jgi:hypothetical protein
MFSSPAPTHLSHGLPDVPPSSARAMPAQRKFEVAIPYSPDLAAEFKRMSLKPSSSGQLLLRRPTFDHTVFPELHLEPAHVPAFPGWDAWLMEMDAEFRAQRSEESPTARLTKSRAKRAIRRERQRE